MLIYGCQMVLMINLSNLPWNDHDTQIEKQAEIRCTQIYKDSPCLTRFVKTGNGAYQALCGKRSRK